MTEQQPYELVQSYDAFELRRYPEHVVAEVVVDGDFESAGNRAFRYLFGYISGDNESRAQGQMTTPVVQERSLSRLAMTAPVLLQRSGAPSGQGEREGEGGREGYLVAFVLPASVTGATAPRPKNSAVRLRTVPQSLVAALSYHGRWTEEGFRRHLDQLRAALAAQSLRATGEPRFARFDPPLKPAFLRHNEVMIDIDDSDTKLS